MMDPTIETINRVIRTRRSVFPASYSTKEISRTDIETVLENANYAPTHKLTQPWRFRVFRKKGLERLANKLGEIYRDGETAESFRQEKYDAIKNKFFQSSCVIAIVMQTHPDKLPEWEELAAVSAAVQNMWLTASALNIGAYWSTPGSLRKIGDFLALNPNEKCVGLFYMGLHDEAPSEGRRGPIEEKTTWIEE